MEAATTQKKRTQRLKRVFAIAKQQGIPAEELRELVVVWGFPRLSQCSYQDLKNIERHLGVWFTAQPGGVEFATQAQLDFLQNLWIEKSEKKSRRSLAMYLDKRTGCSNPTLLSTTQISRVIQGLQKWT